MTTQTKALKLALEALENSIDLVSNEAREAESLYGKYPSRIARIQGLVALEVAHEKAITASKEALAQPEQEPVAWMYESVCGNDFATRHCAPSYAKNIRPLYTTPPQRTWVGLTDEDKAFCVQATVKRGSTYELIAAIEAKLKEKNTK